jgi:hypothetical protein
MAPSLRHGDVGDISAFVSLMWPIICAFSHPANFFVSMNIAAAATESQRTNFRHMFANTALFAMAAMAFAGRFLP